MTPREPGSTRSQENGSADPPAGGIEGRLERLELRLGEMEARIALLEGRPAALRALPKPAAPVRAAQARPVPAAPSETLPAAAEPASPVGYLGLAGMAFLLFGGAFFLRSITDTGVVPSHVGVGMGMAYAFCWLIVADRVKRDAVSTAFTLAAAAIFFPMLLEATLRLKALSPAVSAFALLLWGPAMLAVAWRRSLLVVAWIATVASLLIGAGLMFSTGAFETFFAVFIAFGAGSLWLTYGRKWHALRWPTALAADWAAVVMTVFMAWPGDAPKDYPAPSITGVLALDMALVFAYLGSFCARILQRRRTPKGFEVLQACAVLLVGFGSAVQTSWNSGIGLGPLGLTAVASGFICYALSFAFDEGVAGERPNAILFTSLALVFLLVGGPMVLSKAGLGLAFSGLGILATALGLRFRREIFAAHGAILLLAATLFSGAMGSLFVAAPPTLHARGLQSILILLSLVAIYGFHGLTRDPERLPWYLRIPSTLVGVLAFLGLSELLLSALSPALGRMAQDPAAFTALRTGLLAILAMALAGASRAVPRSGVRWLAYPMLAVAGAQLLAQAFPNGRPFTLFLAFTCFGAALAITPRLLKRPAEQPAS